MENYRLSSYTIDVELNKAENKSMLVHGYSGAIDIVNSQIVSFLKANCLKLEKENFPFSEKTWEALIRRNYVTQKTEKEEVSYVKKMADLLHRKLKIFHNNFGFLVSYDCNFRCPYCYEAKISNDGNNWSKATFTKEQVDKAYEAMLQIEPRRELHMKKLLLYGGEPLLKENKDIIRYIVKKGKEKGYVFSCITNGFDLHHYEELLNSEEIVNIQITIDGWKENHNKKRIHFKESETFDQIISNIGLALEKDISVTVRMNSDSKNIGDIQKLKDYFIELGYFNFEKFNFYQALLYDYLKKSNKETKSYMARGEFSVKMFQEHPEFDFEDFNASSMLLEAMVNNKQIAFRPIPCSAQCGSYIFDPHGKIYSCWESLGSKGAEVGHYNGKNIEWTSLLEKWQNRSVSKIEKCSRCKYAFFHGGGCLVHALEQGGDFSSAHCNDYPTIFEVAVKKAYSKYTLARACVN